MIRIEVTSRDDFFAAKVDRGDGGSTAGSELIFACAMTSAQDITP
jgi:hypothetical protein